jgi:hypothetical protein
VAAEDPSPDGLKHIRRRWPHVANSEFHCAALTEPHIDWESRKSPRVDDVIKCQVWVEWLAVAPDLPLISRGRDLSRIPREAVGELRKVVQNAAVVSVQCEPGQDDLLAQPPGCWLDTRVVEYSGVERVTARFALACADATTQFTGGHRHTP